ncbi:hypothetical protein D3C80_1832520 [compost metagenome]
MGVSTNDFSVFIQPFRELAGRFFRRFAQAQTAQVWQGQRAATAHVGFATRTGSSNMAKGIGTFIAKAFGIFTRANAE